MKIEFNSLFYCSPGSEKIVFQDVAINSPDKGIECHAGWDTALELEIVGCTMFNSRDVVVLAEGHDCSVRLDGCVLDGISNGVLLRALNGNTIEFEMTDTAPSSVRQQAAFNCAMNPTDDLGEEPVDAIVTHVGADLAQAIAAETVKLAHVEGFDADMGAVEKQLAFALASHGGHKPSMLQDLEAGRPTEITALNGYVAARARALGLDVPLNRLLAALVEMKEAARTG